jgi:hypothetical protein
MKINNSLDWPKVRGELSTDISKLNYDPSLRLMLKNIDTMVSELSKIEVEARRTKSTYLTAAKLDKINESIDALDKFVMLGILLS